MKVSIAAAFAVLGAVPSHAGDFYLLCLGGGSATKETTSSAFGSNNYGDSAWATATGIRDVSFEDQVNIEIVDGAGKIRMPRTMLPAIRGGKNGWFEIERLKIGENEITGNAGVNFMNSPKVRVDRTTGMLSISGKSGNFTAQCKTYDPASKQRAF